VFLPETAAVERSKIQVLAFGNLTHREQRWYQAQLEIDMLRRFEVNFPVLFANQGCDMLGIKMDLLDDPAATEKLIGQLAQNVNAAKAMSKVSPNLSAANNAALMVAAKIHENLNKSKGRNWHQKYLKQIEDLRERCNLSMTVNTIVRYRKVGELMMRSNVVACLLPSFVAVAEDAIEALLTDEDACKRLDNAFEAKLRSSFGALGDSKVLQGLAAKTQSLALESSFLEVEAQKMLLESGTAGQDDGSLLLPMAESSSSGRIKVRTGKKSKKRE
jgi:hypothetical protein